MIDNKPDYSFEVWYNTKICPTEVTKVHGDYIGKLYGMYVQTMDFKTMEKNNG